jgi:hypothetical protein
VRREPSDLRRGVDPTVAPAVIVGLDHVPRRGDGVDVDRPPIVVNAAPALVVNRPNRSRYGFISASSWI